MHLWERQDLQRCLQYPTGTCVTGNTVPLWNGVGREKNSLYAIVACCRKSYAARMFVRERRSDDGTAPIGDTETMAERRCRDLWTTSEPIAAGWCHSRGRSRT